MKAEIARGCGDYPPDWHRGPEGTTARMKMNVLRNTTPHEPLKRALPESVLLLTIGETVAATRLSRASVYRLMNRGEIKSIGKGRARRIPLRALERWIEKQS